MHPVILHLASLTPHRPLGVIIPTLLRLGRRVTASEGEVSSRPPPHYSPSCLLCLCGLKISERFISPIIGELSKKYPHVTTYKIDIDQISPCSKAAET
ncbi:hypothetical protein HN51_059018 [Arachis hypogaea]